MIFTSANFKLMILGLAMLVLGFVLLGQGPVFNPLSWTLAPLILVAAYLVVIPMSIFVGRKPVGDQKGRGSVKKGV